MDAPGEKPEPRRFGTYVLVIILLTGWAITTAWTVVSYKKQVVAFETLAARTVQLQEILSSQAAETRQELTAVVEKVSTVERYSQNQTAMIAQVVGDIIPVQMPPNWDDELTRLEAIAKSPGDRPRDASSAATFKGDAKQLISATPSWAESYYVERLANLRWAGLVFVEVNRNLDVAAPEYLENLQQHFDNLVELEAIAPTAHDPSVMELLHSYSDRILTESKAPMRSAVMKKAEAVMAREISAGDPGADALAVIGWIDRIDSDHELLQLKDALTQRLTESELLRHMAQVKVRYESLKATAENDPELLEQGTRLLVGDLGAMRGRLAFEGKKLDDLDTLYKALEDDLLVTQAAAFDAETFKRDVANVSYQQWALGKVKDAESALANAKRKAGDNTLIYGEKWTNHEFQLVKKAMLALLEVDARFLDWPVAELYQETLAEGSKILQMNEDGKVVRKELAREGIAVEKRPLLSE